MELASDLFRQVCQLLKQLQSFAGLQLWEGERSCHQGLSTTAAKVPEDFTRGRLRILKRRDEMLEHYFTVDEFGRPVKVLLRALSITGQVGICTSMDEVIDFISHLEIVREAIKAGLFTQTYVESDWFTLGMTVVDPDVHIRLPVLPHGRRKNEINPVIDYFLFRFLLWWGDEVQLGATIPRPSGVLGNSLSI